ncbi:uncharacterized protein LOC132169445 [Corylus avellana]|uniref:uncharacterized protein LOC132169445 n=1 Tax=Corylus avellana TaxID=13451 RepID=UPI001E210A87|nr:uncharacterized protein LOC132169445 [Corylus avellana]
MGFNKNLNNFLAAILFLFLLIITPTSPSPSSPHEIQPKAPPAAIHGPPAEFRVFHHKNTNTFFLDKEEELMSKKKRMISRRKIPKRKKMKKNRIKAARPFSVMLPKGFVPPSGSSPCHNEYPTSVSYCELSTTKP